MPDPKRRPTLVSVDENYVAPENATPGETLKAQFAATKRDAIAEGIRRQKAKQDTETLLVVQGIKSAHVDELNRISSVARTTGYWRGFAIGGMIVGSLVGTALAIYAAAIINPAFDAAARMQMQQSVVDTMQRGTEQ